MSVCPCTTSDLFKLVHLGPQPFPHGDPPAPSPRSVQTCSNHIWDKTWMDIGFLLCLIVSTLTLNVSEMFMYLQHHSDIWRLIPLSSEKHNMSTSFPALSVSQRCQNLKRQNLVPIFFTATICFPWQRPSRRRLVFVQKCLYNLKKMTDINQEIPSLFTLT